MRKKGNVFTVSTSSGWANKVNGEAVSRHRTQAAAEQGRTIAWRNHSEHTIMNQHGQFRTKNSYGSDPNPPRDKNR
jgi:hypothetical protein